MNIHYHNPVIRLMVFVGLLALSASPASAGSSNKWRIEVSEGANSDGEIVFQVTPEGGEAIEVRVAVEDGTRENKVARTISDAFESQLPSDDYHVEVDDGEDVLVKKEARCGKFRPDSDQFYGQECSDRHRKRVID
jgi:hypothetical protein